MFGLLVVDSFFTAGTAMLLLLVSWRQIGSYSTALGAALVYLLNYAVPNLRLAGLVDAGEGFFLMLLVWALFKEKYWILPLCGALGALAKESFVPFMIMFTLAWWLLSRGKAARPVYLGVGTVCGWVSALTSLVVLHWSIAHVFQSPMQFGMQLHQNTAYSRSLLDSLADRQLWYIFIWLLPLSIPRLNVFSRRWRWATAATAVTALAMNTWYGGAPGTLGRALFSIAGPLLSASVAVLLFSRADSAASVKKPLLHNSAL
jgi:uncharacterized membrane protein